MSFRARHGNVVVARNPDDYRRRRVYQKRAKQGKHAPKLVIVAALARCARQILAYRVEMASNYGLLTTKAEEGGSKKQNGLQRRRLVACAMPPAEKNLEANGWRLPPRQ